MTFEEVVANSQLTPLQIKAIGAILRTNTLTEAAQQIGVNRSTLFRWRSGIPGFEEALTAGRKQLAEEVLTEARATWQAQLLASRSW
ncbi:MAG: hypothetical protein KDJ52_17630 [Anaerolineae bacterium]|nr:hypothetical protein [Anaerolineae bacterium]